MFYFFICVFFQNVQLYTQSYILIIFNEKVFFILCFELDYHRYIVIVFGSLHIANLIDRLIEQEKPCQVTIYADKENFNNGYYDLVFKNLIKQMPTHAVRLNGNSSALNYSSGGFFKYNKNISEPLHVIMLKENAQLQNQLGYIFRWINLSLMYLTTTKFFLVFFRQNHSFSAINEILIIKNYKDYYLLN